MENIKKQQKEICERYNAIFIPVQDNLKVGISESVKDGVLPLHGLRHPPEGDTSGWYIWAGEYSEDVDFFKPLHIAHLEEWSKLVLKYLGLPPGFRFLTDGDYEDVWFDEELLYI